jgi:hypothetical protein
MANKMRVLEGKKVGQKGAVHGAESSGELDRNSGERFIVDGRLTTGG